MYEFSEAVVAAWVEMLYRACEPKIHARVLTPEQAAEFIALGDEPLAEVERERPDLHAKVKPR